MSDRRRGECALLSVVVTTTKHHDWPPLIAASGSCGRAVNNSCAWPVRQVGFPRFSTGGICRSVTNGEASTASTSYNHSAINNIIAAKRHPHSRRSLSAPQSFHRNPNMVRALHSLAPLDAVTH
jgi:hypothetical protein